MNHVLLQTFKDLSESETEVFIAKNADYGDSVTDTFLKFGMVSFLTRINDKVNRLNTLHLKGTQEVKDESFMDTLLDLSNYAKLAAAHMKIYRSK